MTKIVCFFCLISLTSCSSLSDISTDITVTQNQVSSGSQDPYDIGTVDTAFKLIGPDHKIEVGGIPDPKV